MTISTVGFTFWHPYIKPLSKMSFKLLLSNVLNLISFFEIIFETFFMTPKNLLKSKNIKNCASYKSLALPLNETNFLEFWDTFFYHLPPLSDASFLHYNCEFLNDYCNAWLQNMVKKGFFLKKQNTVWVSQNYYFLW